MLKTDGDLLGVIVRFGISLGSDDYLMGGLKSRYLKLVVLSFSFCRVARCPDLRLQLAGLSAV